MHLQKINDFFFPPGKALTAGSSAALPPCPPCLHISAALRPLAHAQAKELEWGCLTLASCTHLSQQGPPFPPHLCPGLHSTLAQHALWGTQLCVPSPLLQEEVSWLGVPLPSALTCGRGWTAHGRSHCGCWGSPAPPGSCRMKAGLGAAAGCGPTAALQGWGAAGLTGTAAGAGSQTGWGKSLSEDCRRCS